MRPLGLVVLALAAVGIDLDNVSVAQGVFSCPVTSMPDPAFEPPFSPYDTEYSTFHQSAAHFYIGTADLWTRSYDHWGAAYSRKIPFFSENFNAFDTPNPRLAVVARRLDMTAPLQWADYANSGHVEALKERGHFMVTGVGDLAPGCWEISAQYSPRRDKVATLSFVVQIEISPVPIEE